MDSNVTFIGYKSYLEIRQLYSHKGSYQCRIQENRIHSDFFGILYFLLLVDNFHSKLRDHNEHVVKTGKSADCNRNYKHINHLNKLSSCEQPQNKNITNIQCRMSWKCRRIL